MIGIFRINDFYVTNLSIIFDAKICSLTEY